MARLDKEREEKLKPERMNYAVEVLKKMNLEITYQDNNRLDFILNGNIIKFYPYSGWFTGKGVKDGRGIKNLIKQLKDGKN